MRSSITISLILVVLPCSWVANVYIRLMIAYLEPGPTVKMVFFCGKSQRLKAVNYFCKKAPSQMFDWVLNTPQDQAIIKRYYYHDFLAIPEHQKCCKNDLAFGFGKIIFLKKHQLTLTQSYVFRVTLGNHIIWNKITALIYQHSKYLRQIKQCYLVIVISVNVHV